MRLEAFHLFADEVRSNPRVADSTAHLQLYRYFEKRWHREDGGEIETTLQGRLELARAAGGIWRPPRSKSVYHWVDQLACVVVTDHRKTPTKRTREGLHDEIKVCLMRSQNAFKATHDSLTGLLNTAAFEAQSKPVLFRAAAPTQSGDEPPGSSFGETSTALLALDVDRFKQVNDTHGHIYGDLVLRALSLRLQRRCEELVATSNQSLRLEVARPGGEEFLVAISVEGKADAITRIAEDVREVIERDSLPSEAEWTKLEGPQSGIKLPPETDRRVTISAGLAFVEAGSDPSGFSKLRARADRALYCAKAAGRNRVCCYDDIVTSHGRVLEHDADTGVVVVDVGREVGVKNGHEFLVFHPKFSGDLPFVRDDGRSRRTLGTYPRIPMGHLVVFNVQTEISFCEVVGTSKSPIPIGASLSVVPLGSISHLIKTHPGMSRGLFPALSVVDDMAEKIKQAPPEQQPVSIVLFGFSDEQRVAEDRGTAFVNSSLARLYDGLSRVFEQRLVVAQVHAMELGVVVPKLARDEIESATATVLREVIEAAGVPNLMSAGIFVVEPGGQHARVDNGELSPQNAIECAAYALSAATSDGGGVEVFSDNTARKILLAARRGRRFESGVRDYQRLTQLGVKNGSVENLGALLAWEMPDTNVSLAVEASARAAAMLPDSQIVLANAGLFHSQGGNMRAAHEYFVKIELLDPKWVVPKVYLDARAMSAAVQWLNGTALQDRDRVVGVIREAIESSDSDEREALEDVLTTIQGQPDDVDPFIEDFEDDVDDLEDAEDEIEDDSPEE